MILGELLNTSACRNHNEYFIASGFPVKQVVSTSLFHFGSIIISRKLFNALVHINVALVHNCTPLAKQIIFDLSIHILILPS
jgi:hypothetical protein